VANWLPVAQYVFFSGLFICLVLVAIKPPGMWDDTMYHLPYARHYLQNQAILINPNLRFPLFPHNGNLLFTLGLMYGSETDAQVLATLPLFVIALGLFGAGQTFLRSVSAGYLAVVLFLALEPVHEALGYAYIDNILALYCWGAVLALALWLRKGRALNHWLVTSGILAGSAAGTKLFGGVVAVVIGLYLVLAVRKLRPVAIYALSTLVFGIGWYLRSFYISGDPVHPAGGYIFGHFIWNAADLLSQQQEQSTHGVEKSLAHLFGALQKAGAVMLVPALFVFVQPGGRRKPVFFLYLCFVLYLLFWLYATQVARYLSPIIALGALLSVLFVYQAGLGTSLRQLGRRWAGLWPRRVAALAVGSCGLALALLSARTVPATLSNWDATLKGRSGYELMSAANSLTPEHGTVLLQVGFENAIYFFNGTVIGDWFGPGRYNNMLRCQARCAIAPAAQMAGLMQGFGARMLAVNSKRFEFNPQSYLDYFEVKVQSSDGYLLTLKK
jgi:4-amino-4-deoxy-L-arabinose transferase-like glycosyltransferase